MKFTIKKKEPEHVYDPRIDGVTQSMIGTWLECREKARLSIVEMLSSTAASRPFIFGDISHRMLDHHYTKLMNTIVWTPRDSVCHTNVWMDQCVEGWYAANKHVRSDAIEIVEESAAIIRQLFPRYVEHWKRQDFSFKWKMVETKFSVDIDVHGHEDSIVKLMGKVDGAFEEDGEGVLFETKNKAQLSDKLGLVLPLDLQLGTYLTAISKSNFNFPKPKRVVYNLIRRPGERRGKTETLNDYANRIAANVDKDPGHYFERYKIKLDEAEMQRHIFGTEFRVAEFFRWWMNSKKGVPDPMWNGNACDGKYGICGMINVCANGDRSGLQKRKSVHPEL